MRGTGSHLLIYLEKILRAAPIRYDAHKGLLGYLQNWLTH